MPLHDIDEWDKILIQLAKILDDARWTIENHSSGRVELCESLICIIPPILLYSSFISMNKFLHNLVLYHILYLSSKGMCLLLQSDKKIHPLSNKNYQICI